MDREEVRGGKVLTGGRSEVRGPSWLEGLWAENDSGVLVRCRSERL